MEMDGIKRAGTEAIADLQLDCEINEVSRSGDGNEWCVRFSGKYGQFCDDFANQFDKDNDHAVIRAKIKSYLVKQIGRIRTSTGRRRTGGNMADKSKSSGTSNVIEKLVDQATSIAGKVIDQAASAAGSAGSSVMNVVKKVSPVAVEVKRKTTKQAKKISAPAPKKAAKQAAKSAKSATRSAGKATKKVARQAGKQVSKASKSAQKTVRKAAKATAKRTKTKSKRRR